MIWFPVVAIMLGLVVLLMVPATFPDLEIERVSFKNDYSGREEIISGLLLEPPQAPDEPMPAVVFSHGFLTNKEMHLSFYRELARRGFAVLAVDLPGHGESGGRSDLGGSEYTALLSAYDWLTADHPEIDPDRVAVAGHSLGGISATKAGISWPKGKFRAVVAIMCFQGLQSAMETVAGPYEDFSGKIWPLFTLAKSFDPAEAGARKERDIISMVEPGVPPNYLVVLGSLDELVGVEQERELVAKAAGLDYVEEGEIYGSFKDGTARELIVTTDDHVTEIFSIEAFDAMYEWLCASFDMQPQGSSPIPFLRFSLWAWILFLAYVLAFIFTLIVFRLLEEHIQNPFFLAPDRSSMKKRKLQHMGIYSSLYYLLASCFVLPLAILIGVTALVPFYLGDIISTIAIVRGLFVLVGGGVFLFIYYKGASANAPTPWRERAAATAWSALPPLAGFALLILIYAPLAHTLYLGPGTPYSWLWFLVYALLVTLILWIEGRYFHLLVLPLFGEMKGRGKKPAYLTCEAGVRGLGTSLLFLPFLLTDPLHLIGRAGLIRMPVLLFVFFISFPVYLIIAWTNLYFRRKKVSLLLPSLGFALAHAFFMTAVLCAR